MGRISRGSIVVAHGEVNVSSKKIVRRLFLTFVLAAASNRTVSGSTGWTLIFRTLSTTNDTATHLLHRLCAACARERTFP